MIRQRTLMVAGMSAVAGSLLWAGHAGAAGLDYTVQLRWGATTPACVDPVVCSGVGSESLTSGTPATETDQPTRLSLKAAASINQPDGNPVQVGVLTYCNGQTLDTTDITSVKLLAAFDLPGVGNGQAEDVATLMITVNSDDPVASADSLYLASNPQKTFTVLENQCADIQLLGRITIEPTLRRDRGACHDKLGNATAAIEDYRAYLYARPEAQDAKEIEERIQVLDGQLEAARKPEDTKSGGGAEASASPSTQGAPQISKGRAVPRPTDRFVPSSRHMPG